MAEHTFAGLSCSEVADLGAAFVLGALEASESAAVRRHLAECPEAHAEMAELHSVIPALFEAVEPIAPPAGLKDRILAAAAAERPAAAPAPRTLPAPREVPPVAPGARLSWLRRPIWAPIALAAAIAALALGAWNVRLQDDLAGLSAYRNGVVAVLDQAARPGAELAVLVDPNGAAGPTGLAAVGADGSVAIAMRDLDPTVGAQVYEAWLIGADNTPIPIGGFQVGASGAASFVTAHATLGPGVTVALTREPGPGATTPTLPIVAAGVAKGQSS